MNFKKYITFGCMALSLGLTSCIGDLDQNPIDPNLESPTNPTLLQSIAMDCYQQLAASGQEGPGSSIISGLDNGRGQYTRALFMMNVFPTDEVIWIWKDDGIYDLCTNTFDATNGNIYGTYSRLFAHIATCNQFLNMTETNTDPEILQLRSEVRGLRALSYYWMIDIFGKSSFITAAPDGKTTPKQLERAELFNWLESELTDILDNGNLAETPVYGRIGKDAVEALLARLYLNAKVYAGVDKYSECAARCENIIARHKGGGFENSGLAKEYLHLFCNKNEAYMPGGENKAENEILWGVPFDKDNLQSYGGTMYLVNGAMGTDDNNKGINTNDFGCSNPWKCMKAVKEFSESFDNSDKRWALWVKGKTANGEGEYKIANEDFNKWGDGYVCIKWTNLNPGTGWANVQNTLTTAPDIFASTWDSPQFSSTDLALIRLSDVYLMYSECAMRKAANTDATKGLEYVNLVRRRAGLRNWDKTEYTADNMLAERGRELYWELTRRSDLVRFGKFTGPDQKLWSWKGNDVNGNQIADRYDVMPIPVNVIASNEGFTQNKGY